MRCLIVPNLGRVSGWSGLEREDSSGRGDSRWGAGHYVVSESLLSEFNRRAQCPEHLCKGELKLRRRVERKEKGRRRRR